MLGAPTMAYETGDWSGQLGFHFVEPKSKSHEIVSVEGASAVTAAISYFVRPTVALELLLAVPFEHDIELRADGSRVASTQHLPPTLSVVWVPDTASPLKPFVGAGLNYTVFFNEKTRGALAGSDLDLDDSVGLAIMGGLRYQISPELSLVVDVRHFDIDAGASLDGQSLGDVEIDPWGYGLSLARRF